MVKKLIRSLLVLVMAFVGVALRAQENANDLAKLVAPVVTPATVAVVYIDLQRLDLEAVRKSVTDMLNAVEPDAGVRRKNLVQDMGQATAAVRRVREAGARHAFAVLTLDGSLQQPLFNYLPVAGDGANRVVEQLNAITAELGRPNGADAELEGQHWPVAEVFGKGVYFGPRSMLRRLKEGKPEDRPSLAQAFSAAGDAPVMLALAPSEDMIRALGALAPSLPNRMGGAAATEQLVKSVKWVAVGVNANQEQRSLKLVVQGADASSVKALQLVFAAVQGQALAALPADAGAAKEAIAELRPKSDEANRLTLTIEGKTAGGVFGEGLTEGLKTAREKARLSLTANHLRQLLLACHLYAADRNGEWPESLQQLVELKYVDRAEILKNPRSAEGEGFIYVKPRESMSKLKDTTTTVMIHEAVGKEAVVGVGFVDGHVEVLPKGEAEKRVGGGK